MDAAHVGSLAITKMLLAAGADAAAKDESSLTALHWLAAGEHDEAGLVPILMKAGADDAARDLNGQTPLDHARVMQKSQILRALQSHRQ